MHHGDQPAACLIGSLQDEPDHRGKMAPAELNMPLATVPIWCVSPHTLCSVEHLSRHERGMTSLNLLTVHDAVGTERSVCAACVARAVAQPQEGTACESLSEPATGDVPARSRGERRCGYAQ
jgi:hypothetical protein